MRIAMVSEHASPLAAIAGEDAGGQNVHVAALSTRLARAGHEVTVWTRRDDAALPPRVTRNGVTVEHVPAGPPAPVAKDDLPRWMGDFSAVLARRWDAEPPQVVHAHFWMSGAAALRVRPPASVVVHTFHALGVVKRRHLGEDDPSPPERLRTERTIALTADRLVATCRDEVAELVALDADASRIDVVPCGVDLSAFTPAGAHDRRGRRRRIVVLGRLVARKGVDDVIRALTLMSDDVELVVAGGPTADHIGRDREARRLHDLSARLGVAERVVMLGAVARDRVPALLRSADVVACTPWYEPFGIVPLEAMACGVPVVASAVGGMLDSVVDGRTGLHVPPRNPRAIATAISRLLDDARLRLRMGVAGRRRAVRCFGWDAVAQATLRSYHSALREPAPARRSLVREVAAR